MRRHDARLLTTAALLSLLCAAATSCLPRLFSGRRDTGGVQMLVAVRAEPAALDESVRQATQVIGARCDAIGVYCRIERQGGARADLIELRVSGAKDFPRVKAILLAEGRLELRPVVSPPSPLPIQSYRTRAEATAAARAGDHDVVPYEEEEGVETSFLLVERAVVTGLDVKDARAAPAGSGDDHNYSINFTLKPEGAQRFGAWTAANVNRYIAIVLNGRAQSAPYIRSQITDSGQITGQFTRQSAEDIALTLRSGNLPVRLEVIEEGTYKP